MNLMLNISGRPPWGRFCTTYLRNHWTDTLAVFLCGVAHTLPTSMLLCSMHADDPYCT